MVGIYKSFIFLFKNLDCKGIERKDAYKGQICLFLGQMRPQHPGHFFVHFEQIRQKIATSGVSEGRNIAVYILADVNDDALVISEEFLDKPGAVVLAPHLFGEMCKLKVLLQRSRRVMPYRTDPLRQIIDHLVQLVVLSFEEQVLRMKIRTLDIPMCPAGLERQNKFVCKYFTERCSYGCAVVGL